MERYKKECQKINEQINPSDEFIQNLKTNLNQKIAEKEKRRYNLSKVAAIFITLTLVSTGAFAKDIGNWFAKMFSNVDESVQVAVEHGFVQNVDMDYIEHDGIAIKVNSLIIDDNKINIVFDVKGEIDGDLAIKDFKLTGDSEEYGITGFNLISMGYDREFKKIEKERQLFFVNITSIERNLGIFENVKIEIDGIYIKNINSNVLNNNCWNFNIDIEKEHYQNLKICSFKIEDENYMKKYNILSNNTGTNIDIEFKDSFDKFKMIEKESLSVESDNGKIFLCRDVCRISDNRIKFNIPLTVYDETENIKIKIKLPDEEIVLNAYKIDNSQDV